jgi:hypothetical protein
MLDTGLFLINGLNVRITRNADGWIARFEGQPATEGTGRTRREAIDNLFLILLPPEGK